ncbi:alpha-D-ribose 1-methylphosphonate 5-triphosphate diphosphatase [Rhodobacteraceae bacterium N5(2021)]|uniref:Alpha-D-ribose 1-methylphosphonate 5-triphosphate diphosphatase n=1 Tax=Gymnodinialimonas phycosphaerae TaxID=2841589 RepID=A0A975YI06_9RHOB|nr:alpha-D-ribose 1-methylphosphonate 5-triphosphate diphosphatase [Gymnodinialimonas phycosphaerae]MBY4891903.1 alpha-D-ribose 1-methylphosphonate 5-triphosphate diphosphatase [Gymnodinialimonas phycosphaerae]
MSDPLVLANARLIFPDGEARGRVTVIDGKIVEIAQDANVPPGAVDCEGDVLAPGLIELHTDNLERHIRPRPAVHWPHDAAIVGHDAELASCGITSVFDAIRVGSIEGTGGTGWSRYARDLADELLALRASGALKISHHLHLRAEVCSHSLLDELAEFGPRDRVGIVSLMDHTPGQRQFADIGQYETYMKGKHGLSHDSFEAHVATRQALGEKVRDTHEAAAVAAAGRLGAVLASHDDTLVDHVERSAGYGIALAEFPTTKAAAQACRANGIAVMMGAPNLVRGGSHSGNVAATDLAEAGLLDILSSDYVPSALLYSAVLLGQLWADLPRAMATVTAMPARAAGLTDRGEIALGHRADLIRFRTQGNVPVLHGVWSAGHRVA